MESFLKAYDLLTHVITETKLFFYPLRRIISEYIFISKITTLHYFGFVAFIGFSLCDIHHAGDTDTVCICVLTPKEKK